jgi:hypothetical protein
MREFLQRKKKEPKKKEKFGRGGLWKLPQLWKSESVASQLFFLMISTSCLDKPSDKTLLGLSTVTTGPMAVNLTMIY